MKSIFIIHKFNENVGSAKTILNSLWWFEVSI